MTRLPDYRIFPIIQFRVASSASSSPCGSPPAPPAARARCPPVRTSAARTNRPRRPVALRPAACIRAPLDGHLRGSAAGGTIRASGIARRATRARSAVRARCPATHARERGRPSSAPASRGSRSAPSPPARSARRESAMSSGRSRSGGTAIRMTSRRYSRSSRKRPRRHFRGKIAVGRGDDRTSIRRGQRSAHRRISPS